MPYMVRVLFHKAQPVGECFTRVLYEYHITDDLSHNIFEQFVLYWIGRVQGGHFQKPVLLPFQIILNIF